MKASSRALTGGGKEGCRASKSCLQRTGLISPVEQDSGKAPLTGLDFFFFFLIGLGASGWEKPQPQAIC